MLGKSIVDDLQRTSLWNRRQVTDLMTNLASLLEAKAGIDLHNESGNGKSGYESMEAIVENYTDLTSGEFLLDLYLKNNIG